MLKHGLSSLCIRCVCLAHMHGCCLLSNAAVKVILLVAHLCARVHCCCTMFTFMLAVYLVVSLVLPTLSVHVRMKAEDSIQCKKQSSQRGSFLWFTALLFLYVCFYTRICITIQCSAWHCSLKEEMLFLGVKELAVKSFFLQCCQ